MARTNILGTALVGLPKVPPLEPVTVPIVSRIRAFGQDLLVRQPLRSAVRPEDSGTERSSEASGFEKRFFVIKMEEISRPEVDDSSAVHSQAKHGTEDNDPDSGVVQEWKHSVSSPHSLSLSEVQAPAEWFPDLLASSVNPSGASARPSRPILCALLECFLRTFDT